jgi:phosphoglycolate phosphatase
MGDSIGRSYRAVLFDLDGTLVDSYAAIAESVNYARREHDLEALDAGRIRGLVGDGLEALLQRAFQVTDVPSSVTDAFERRYDEICCERSTVLEHVVVTLEQLDAEGVAMGVCTNKPTAFSTKILGALGLARYFRAVVGPDLAGARKPDARHVLRTLEAMQCNGQDALFVGDMPIDVEAARNGGIDVAVIATGSSSAAELRETNADYYVDTFADLLRVVRNGARE